MATPAVSAAPEVELPSYGKSLFSGVIADDLLFPYPDDDDPEFDAWLEDLRRFLEAKVDAATFDREAGFPEGVIEGLAERGALGVWVPREYDGLGFSQLRYSRVMELVARHDAALGVLLGAHLSIGIKGIDLFGTEEQKRRWLPRCARGETLAAFALTEAEHGSDAAHIESRARPEGDQWILDGHKIWIGNAHRAGVITTFAQTPVQKEGKTVDRITAFVLEGDDEGLEIGRLWTDEKLGIRASTQAELVFRGIRLADDRILDRPGHGFKVAMHILNGGRVGLAAGAVGGIHAALGEAAVFASRRRQFGRPIAEFDLVRGKLARIRLDAWVAEAMVRVTASLMDRGVDYALESAMCKVFASEAAWRAADDALQIAGGRGYMRDRPFERYLRDARILRIFEGTNEVLRTFIALAGMERLGDYLENVGQALREPIKEIGVLTGFAFHRIRHRIGTPRATVEVAEPLRGPLRHLERFVGILHNGAESTIHKHRERIVEEQFQLARLADIAIDVYALTAAISRGQAEIEARGVDGAREAIDYVRQFSREAGARIERARAQIGENQDERLRRIAARVVAQVSDTHTPRDPGDA
jgi:alkylation response protein AidB-like acyl-CoA dehydrogenase